MRVTLVSIQSKYVHASLAVWYLAAGVEFFTPHHTVQVLESSIHQPSGELAQRIAATAPEVVGISCYIWNASMLPELLSELHALLPQTILLLGGPEAGQNAAHWLRQGAGYVLCGEGEQSLPLLLDALEKGENPDTVPGLCRLSQGEPLRNAQSAAWKIPPDPFSQNYFHALAGRIAYMETSRGCPFRCTFCLSGKEELRFFPLEEAKRQMALLANSGARTVKLVDRTFNCNPHRAYHLFEYVLSLQTQSCFHFEIAADLLDEKTLVLLATAVPGRIQLEIGLQSFYEPTLQAVNRKTNLELVRKTIRTLLAPGNIHVHIDLIAGLPLESFAQFGLGFDRAFALGAHTLQLGFLKLLHGSALRERADELGLEYDSEPPYEIRETPHICASEMEKLRQCADALEHTYNNGRFLHSLHYVLQASGLRPFFLFLQIGAAVRHFLCPLEDYAEGLFALLLSLPGVERLPLRDAMVCDFLSAVKGEGLPAFLRSESRPPDLRKQVQTLLGHHPARGEYAVLLAGGEKAVAADSKDRDPVTGLYRLHYLR